MLQIPIIEKISQQHYPHRIADRIASFFESNQVISFGMLPKCLITLSASCVKHYLRKIADTFHKTKMDVSPHQNFLVS